MNSTRDIQVSTDVYAAIWAARHPGEHTEDAILRRLLRVSAEASAPGKRPTAPRPTLIGDGNDGELRGVLENLLKFPTAELRAKPADTDRPLLPINLRPAPTVQERLELLAYKLSEPFRLVY